MKTRIKTFLADRTGSVFEEYGIIAILVGFVLLTVLIRLQSDMITMYGKLTSNVS
jgi:Flp pilus assembly pilin Flp